MKKKSSTPERPIIDGLMYNPLLRYLPMRSLPLLYERLKEVRTGPYQPRLYTVPSGNGGDVIGAGLTVVQQVRMAVDGCKIIGYCLGTLTDTPATFGVVIFDADADITGEGTSSYGGYPFVNGIDRYVVGNAFAPASITGVSGVSGQRFVLLMRPYDIVSNILTVKLSNLSVTDNVQVQLVIYVMEPFTVPDDTTT